MLDEKQEESNAIEMIGKHDQCQLCLRVVIKSEYDLFNEIHIEVLEVLLTNEINKSSQFVICNDCSKMLYDSFGFKASCLYTEDSLTPFFNTQNLGKLDISMVFGKIHNDDKSLLLRNSNICRFCLKILENVSFTLLTDLSKPDFEMLKKVTPEINLEATKEPVICEICLQCFQDTFKFINLCLNVLKHHLKWASLNDNLDLVSLQNKIRSNNDLFSFETDSQSPRKPDYAILAPNETKKKYDKSTPTSYIYKCDKCTYKAKSKYSFNLHKTTHNKEETYTCDECGFKTTCKIYLTTHLKRRHIQVEPNTKKYACELCPIKTKNIKNLKIHRKTHEEPTNTFKCYSCAFITRYKACLKAHMTVHKHSEVEIYRCEKCSFQSKYKRSLTLHNLVHMKPEETTLYKCELCQFSANRKSGLLRHRKVHMKLDEVELYKCNRCTYQTKYKDQLVYHNLVHKSPEETKMYKCEKCLFESKHKQSLNHHNLLHNDPRKAKLYSCDVCPYQSKHRFLVTRHSVVHKKPSEVELYNCQLCEFSSKLKGGLAKHQLVHKDLSEVQIFQCANCDYKTKQKECLKHHVQLHMNVFHKCEFCEYKARCKAALYKHLRRVHKGKINPVPINNKG